MLALTTQAVTPANAGAHLLHVRQIEPVSLDDNTRAEPPLLQD